MRDSKVNQFSFGNHNIPTEDQIEEKWEKVNLKERTTNIYIKSLEASEIEIDVSFIARLSSDVQNLSDQMVRDRNYFQSIGLALITIENAPIRINKLNLRNAFGTQNDMNYIFTEYYSSSIKKNFLSIIGSTEILGNPVN